MTRLTVLLSSIYCASRPYGCHTFVLPPTHIELLRDTADLRDSVAQHMHSRFEREVVHDPWRPATSMPPI